MFIGTYQTVITNNSVNRQQRVQPYDHWWFEMMERPHNVSFIAQCRQWLQQLPAKSGNKRSQRGHAGRCCQETL